MTGEMRRTVLMLQKKKKKKCYDCIEKSGENRSHLKGSTLDNDGVRKKLAEKLNFRAMRRL
eukprot:8296562-Pyramimonas_sp.AAC.1